MHSEVPARDVMIRTIWNLDFVNEYRKREDCGRSEGPFEVTQLVNSFLGALAHPWERLTEILDTMQLTEIESLQWPEVPNDDEAGKALDTVGDLVRLVRNAFAHGNIEFLPNDDNEIRAIRFWNENGQGERTWGSTLDIETLQRFLYCFVKIAEDNEAALCRPRTAKTHSAADLLRRAHQQTIRANSTQLAKKLRDTLGQRPVAAIAGIENPRIVGEWASGRLEPNHDEKERLQEAFQLTTLLTLAESQHAARAWLTGMNPLLDDRSPVSVLSENPKAGTQVMKAARAFLAHG
jgi:hypothetical protein